jgi:hypothetical protein
MYLRACIDKLLFYTLKGSIFCDRYCAMGRKPVALLLVLSWMVLSGVDILEDLNLESRSTPSASSSPTTANPVKLANDNIELANRVSLPFEKFSRSMDLENTYNMVLTTDFRTLRSHKDNCVFLI